MSDPARCSGPVVDSHNGWDPLEGIIVGVLDGVAMPPLELHPGKTSRVESIWVGASKASTSSAVTGPCQTHHQVGEG